MLLCSASRPLARISRPRAILYDAGSIGPKLDRDRLTRGRTRPNSAQRYVLILEGTPNDVSIAPHRARRLCRIRRLFARAVAGCRPDLSEPAGQVHHSGDGRRLAGHGGAHRRTAFAGAAQPIDGGREPAGRQRQRVGCRADVGAGGRSFVHHPGRIDRVDQSASLRQPQLQGRRSRAGGADRARAAVPRRASEGARPERSRNSSTTPKPIRAS